MSRNEHTPEMHQQAFELYRRTRNRMLISKELGICYATVYSWMRAEYRCQFACPWHGWDKLIVDSEKANAASYRLLEEGNMNPLDHQEAMKLAMTTTSNTRLNLVQKFTRTDKERLGHFEYLYSKVYFHLTGIPIAFDDLVEAGVEDPEVLKIKLKEALGKGLAVTNFESGLRCLSQLMEHIKALQDKLGINKPEQSDQTVKKLSIHELRQLRAGKPLTPVALPETELRVLSGS